MKAFQQNLAKLEDTDTQVLVVSMDSPFSNFAFARQNGITFPMLGDWGGPVTRRYGLTENFDVEGIPMESARRATFLIDKSGAINEQVGDAAVDRSRNRGSVRATQAEKLSTVGGLFDLCGCSRYLRGPRPGGVLQTPGVSRARDAEIGGLHFRRYPAHPLDVDLPARRRTLQSFSALPLRTTSARVFPGQATIRDARSLGSQFLITVANMELALPCRLTDEVK